MNKINVEHMKGFGDLMNLLMLVKNEAERLFQQKGLKLAETEISMWSGTEEETVEGNSTSSFGDRFLDVWYEKSPEIYEQAHKECDAIELRVMGWIYEKHPDLHKEISSQTIRAMSEAPAEMAGAEHDDQNIFVSFRFHRRKDGTVGYGVELWATDPPVITMIDEDKFVREVEGKQFDMDKLDEGWAHLERPLATVVEKETTDQQREEMYRLSAEMYDELDKMKKPLPKTI